MRFVECIRKLHFYFKVVKLPSDDTMDLWASEIGEYPQDFYSWLYDTMKGRENDMPRNLPRAIQELWQEWLRRNPEKCERREFSCRQPRCQDGLLFVVRGTSTYAFRCGECDARGDLPMYPIARLNTLLDDGYRVDSVENTMERKPDFDADKWCNGRKSQWTDMDTVEKLAKQLMEKGSMI